MGTRKRRPLGSSRPGPSRRYRKLFVVGTEGTKTELEYLAHLSDACAAVQVFCVKRKGGSAPLHVLKRVKDHLKAQGLRKTDEAWVVIDRDSWNTADIDALYDWQATKANYGLAVSNPKFELWLLLHFENGSGAATSAVIDQRIKARLPGYDKGISRSKFDRTSIQAAIARAKAKDSPPCADWPKNPPATTVYRLVENILNA